MATTGHVITAAATIMVCVFLAFVLPSERPVVIRSLLLPAVLELLGRWTWALPGWLGRILPRVATEPAADTTPRREVPHGR